MAKVLTLEDVKELPEEIVAEVKDTLEAYDDCDILFYSGRYHVEVGEAITKAYPEDFRYVGFIEKDVVYTKEEQIANYINVFNSYPLEYKGIRDYAVLRQMCSDRPCEKLPNGQLKVTKWYGKINETGNFELVGTKDVII